LIVIDASALLEVLLGGPAAGPLGDRLFRPDESLHAPHLLDVELAQVLRRYTLAGELDASRGNQAIEDLAVFPIHRYGHQPFLARIWALRRNVTAYDAVYLALAEGTVQPSRLCESEAPT
jgi:predicted nucleic acid-binding protein